jgi:hypothetical protein
MKIGAAAVGVEAQNRPCAAITSRTSPQCRVRCLPPQPGSSKDFARLISERLVAEGGLLCLPLLWR